MSELSEILRKEYKKKEEKKPIDFSMLMEMIEQLYDAVEPEVMDNSPLPATGYILTKENDEYNSTTEEGPAANVTSIRRPVVKITELWGQPGKNDRMIMESMMKQIVGPTVKEKIKSVNEFLDASPEPGQGDISEVMSYLIFLDTFASIISDYGASVSGFLFEAFLAALFGNTSIQVDDPEQVGAVGSLPIEDNQLWMQLRQCREAWEAGDECEEWGLVPYSLKVLRQDGVVHGSYKNLVDFFLSDDPKRKSDSITYLIVIKDAATKGEGKGNWTGLLKFYEFVITRETFLNIIGRPEPVAIFDYVPYTVPGNKGQSVGVAIMADGSRRKLAQIRGMDFYRTEEGQAWPEDERIPKGTNVQRLQQVGTKDVASAKLFTPEEYAKVKGEFTDVEVSRQVFAALRDTKGYGSKAKGGAQWSVPRTSYEEGFIGSINLEPNLLKEKAEEYTQSLNASIVSIFNALGALSDNINRYFISGKKTAGTDAIGNARVLKDEVNNVIPEEGIEQREVSESKEKKDLTNDEEVIIIDV
jgi:hypothetical protein